MLQRTSLKTIIVLLTISVCVYSYAAENVCFVCDEPVAGNETQVEYRGSSHPVCAGYCLKTWESAIQEGKLDALVFKVEPRGALFQGDSKFLNPTFQKNHPLSNNWLWMGIWIVTAIVSGGWAAALAIVSHRSGLLAFVLGFLLPGLGILIIKFLPGKSGKFELRGTKVPTTHNESYCPQCNHPSHPSAERCIGCGASLTPKFKSEVFRGKE